MAKIYVKKNESIDRAIERFNLQCIKEGIKRSSRAKEFYTKPSEAKKEKASAAKKKLQKQQSKNKK